MERLNITEEQWTAFNTGFHVSEREGWDSVEPSAYTHIEAVAKHPEIFKEGVALRNRLNMVFSADSSFDYRNDCARFDLLAEELNNKYGQVVHLTDEKVEGYGLVGSRSVPFEWVTAHIYKDGEKSVEVRNIREEVEAEDADIRKKMSFKEEE